VVAGTALALAIGVAAIGGIKNLRPVEVPKH
jgi:hypothetical protein